MRELNYGIEIEFTGITRRKAAEIVAEHFGTRVGGTDSRYFVEDQENRKWLL
ncbi:MAG: amidoligase family protein, partial [Bacillota bacterium]